MEVIYRGPNPLNYHSAPSGFEYLFDPGVPQKVQKGDECFFEGMSKAPGSRWEVVRIADKMKGGKK
jgi:hypothetical protein